MRMHHLAFVCILVTILVLALSVDQSTALDQNILEQMQQTIIEQQKQLRLQAEQIRMQSERLDIFQQQLNSLKVSDAPKEHPVSAIAQPAPRESTKEKSLMAFETADGRKRVAISGQVNRAVNIINDGKSTNVYHIDNNVSNSRIRFVAAADVNDDISIGSRIEFSVSPDVSSRVSQNNHAPGSVFDQRWVELSLTSKSFGKLSLGKGDTASNTTAEMDLSGTDMVQYANIADIAAGMLFREKHDQHSLTIVKTSDVFKDRDGLSRESRLRYDTPEFYGFSIAGSLVSNQRSDAALFWKGEGNGLKGTAAFAIANPKLSGSRLQYNGSLSVLHGGTGLNLTLSGGFLENSAGEDPANLYAKIGWLAQFTKLGYTAFGVDYTRSENLPLSDDKAWSVGAAVVQAFNRIATELYMQYRIFELDRKSGPAVDAIKVGTVGARVKF